RSPWASLKGPDQSTGVRVAGGQIRSIDPAAAPAGAEVTLVGTGLGGPNVRVAVGRVPAQIVSVVNGRKGTALAFLVPPGVPPGPTTVTAINPGGQGGAIAFTVLGGHPPTAAAGLDQTVVVGTIVQLDGSASTDMDGDHLTFHWSLLSVPEGSAAALSDPTAVKPTFSADRAGPYLVQLVVNPG